MTTWRFTKPIGEKENHFLPRPFRADVQLWREFATLTAQSSDANDHQRPPAVVHWLARLKQQKALNKRYFKFQTAGVVYGSMMAAITDVFSDSLTLSSGILAQMDTTGWIGRIIATLEVTQLLVDAVARLAQAAAKAQGDADGATQRDEARRQAYYRLDAPFRAWLEGIDPDTDEMGDVEKRWWEQSKAIVRALGYEMVQNLGPQALAKRAGQAVPEAYNWFLINTSSAEALRRANTKGGAKGGKARKKA
jgi:CRISPR system Cascade subunit CasA